MFGLRRQLVNPTGIRRTIASSHDHRSLHVSAILRASADMQITRGRIQMYRIKEMLERVSGTNRPREKVAIVKEYEDLRPVIELTFDRHFRYNLRSSAIISHLAKFPDEIGEAESLNFAVKTVDDPMPQYDILENLLRALGEGKANIPDVITYMRQNGIFGDARTFEDILNLSLPNPDPQPGESMSTFDVFLRIIDKELKIGFGHRLVRELGWDARNDLNKYFEKYAKDNGLDRDSDEPDMLSAELPDAISAEPALGKTILREDLAKLFADRNGADWFASRKLDGVRCLIVIDISIENNEPPQGPQIKMTRAKCYSRTGKAFHVLQPLLDDVKRCMDNWPHLINILQGEPSITEDTYEVKWLKSVFVENKRFVLDGELCIIKESEEEGGVMIEDFKGVVGKVRRKSGQADDVRMFVLDAIPWSNFDSSHQGSGDFPPVQKTFSERQKDVVEILHRMSDVSLEGEDHSLYYLPQDVVKNVEEVEHLIGEVSKEGWEGLVLRRDVPYEGKRTSNIRKYKEWLDAEYTVTDVELNTMRLPVNGEYADRQALANVWIEHKGVSVKVGSGFTTAQRLAYAKDSSQIIGKQITVEYFGESTSDARDKKGGGLSLRFPRVKHIWEDGKRDI